MLPPPQPLLLRKLLLLLLSLLRGASLIETPSRLHSETSWLGRSEPMSPSSRKAIGGRETKCCGPQRRSNEAKDCEGEAAEKQQKSSREAAEEQRRSSREAAEKQQRSSKEAAEKQRSSPLFVCCSRCLNYLTNFACTPFVCLCIGAGWYT